MTSISAEGTSAFVLRPPVGFEDLYQGQSASTPIPLVPVSKSTADRFDVLDQDVSRTPIDNRLVRYTRVGRDSTLKLWFPKLYAVNQQSGVVEGYYQYEISWRMRQLADLATNPGPWSLADSRGVPDTSSGSSLARQLLPSADGAIIVPQQIGDNARPLVGVGVSGTLSQGVYDPNSIAAASSLANTYYEPQIIHSRADEMLIQVRRVNDNDPTTWDFTAAASDGPFSNYYGTNRSGTAHPIYPFLGVLAYITTGQP